MSGIEVVGLLLGAFPLIISALEHYEDTRKVARTWWKYKRAHRKDLGRVIDCQLKFHLNLKALLAPLQSDGTISRADHDRLLTDTGDLGWRNAQVQDALQDRLGPTKESFFAVLAEMDEAIAKLARASMVTEKAFQEKLDHDQKLSQNSATSQRLANANEHLTQELKRITYSVTGFKREALLDEVERYNSTLSDFLRSCDDIAQSSAASEPSSKRRVRRQYRGLLSFWKHADSIFRLLVKSWRCKCAPLHCAYLWLGRLATPPATGLDVCLKFCDEGRVHSRGPWHHRSMQIKLGDAAQAHKIASDEHSKGVVGFALPTVLIENLARLNVNDSSTSAENRDCAMPIDSTIPSHALDAAVSNAGVAPADLQKGLCFLAQSCGSLAHGTCVARLVDDDTSDTYELFRHCDTLEDCETMKLSDLLGRRSGHSLFRTQRLTLAFTLASSFLQYYATGWLANAEQTLSQCICLPIAPDTKKLLHEQPFVTSQFCQQATDQAKVPNDYAFVALGIVLLELCFNRAIEEHPMWEQEIGDPEMMNRPWVRKAVAMEWSKDVVYEADADYAGAVDWCLSHATLRDADWRLEFARNVVQPLKTCYDAVPRA